MYPSSNREFLYVTAKIAMLVASFMALLFGVAASAESTSAELLRTLPNVRFPADNRVVSGAIDEDHIAQLRAAGIEHVIDLRPPEEHPALDEARLVKEQGLDYHVIPIKGIESLTRDNALELHRLLEAAGDDPTLVHCSSGNRVGALIALREAWIKGRSTQDAIEEGRRWGMTRLEEPVKALLER